MYCWVLGVHLAHVHPGGVLQSGLGRHGGSRRRVVAGDDLDADPLPPEVVQGVGGPGADGVGEDQGGQGRHFRERAIRIDGTRGGSNHQHPFAPPDLRAQLLREARAGHAVGRAHHQSAQLREGHSAPLPLGGEGNFSGGRLGNVPDGKAGPHGLEGGVVVVNVGQERPHPIRQGNGQVLCQLHHPLHPHVSLGEGAGLVQAQHVHMGQALQGEQVLYQHPGFGQLGHSHRQTDGDQQHQPLGEHPQQPAAVVVTAPNSGVPRRTYAWKNRSRPRGGIRKPVNRVT